METNGPLRAVVLVNGEFPAHAVPREILGTAAYLACTDGAALQLRQHLPRARPQVVVGDGDSLPEALRAALGDTLVQIREQESCDLTKTTHHLQGLGFTAIDYVGIGGGRDDHAIANFALLMHYHRDLGLAVRGFSNYGCFIPACGERIFAAVPGAQVSVFNFGAKNLVSHGLKWPVHAFAEWWQGTLNETENGAFSLNGDGEYVVYVTYEPKRPPVP